MKQFFLLLIIFLLIGEVRAGIYPEKDSIKCCDKILIGIRQQNNTSNEIANSLKLLNTKTDSVINKIGNRELIIHCCPNSKEKEDRDSIWDKIISDIWKIILSIITALITSIVYKWRKFNNLKIKQEEIIKQLESENYKTLYTKRLEALKLIRNIIFKYYKTNLPYEDSSIDEVYLNIALNSSLIANELKEILIEYGYIFDRDIYDNLNYCFIIISDTISVEDPNDIRLYKKGEEFLVKYNELVEKFEKVLMINSRNN